MEKITSLKNLLFGHQTVQQTILKNTFWLTASEAISRFATFVLWIYIARILGAAEFGKFNFAIAIVGLFSILPVFISPEIVTREFAGEKEREKEYPALLSLKIILGLGAVVLLAISSFFVTGDPAVRKVILILALYNFFLGFFDIICAFLRARQRMEYEAFAKVLDALLTTAFGLFVIFRFPSLENLSYAYLLEGLAFISLVLLFFHFKIYPLSLAYDKAVWRQILILSWPLALISIVVTIYNQIDTIIMGYLGQMAQTGWYSASQKIVRLSLVPVALISQAFYPVLSGFFRNSQQELQKIWDRQMEIMIFLAIPLVIGGITLAPRILIFFYGPGYLPSVLALQILMIMAGIVFLSEAFRQILVVANRQTKTLEAVLAGAAINILLNLILIPRFSLYGAAAATVITNIFILFLLIIFTKKLTMINPFNNQILLSFFGAGLSGSLMYFIIKQPQINNLPVVFLILAAAAVYVLAIFGFQLSVQKLIIKRTI